MPTECRTLEQTSETEEKRPSYQTSGTGVSKARDITPLEDVTATYTGDNILLDPPSRIQSTMS